MTKRRSCIQLASLIIGVCIMTNLTSCGGNHVASGGGNAAKNPILRTEKVEGKYKVNFIPLNSSVSGNTTAVANIEVLNDKVSVNLKVKDAPAQTFHAQAIYNAETCPSEIHDVNNDGFIDPLEASKVIGAALIPLDGNLNSQEEGSEEFPFADFMGNYYYQQTGVFSVMLDDLKMMDTNLQDNLSKLAFGEKFRLEGKIVVLHGVAEEVYLPGSIQTLNNISSRVALPIACGKIVRDYSVDSEGEL
jgi:hypothetical protein